MTLALDGETLTLKTGHYGNEVLAVTVVGQGGDPYAKLSVNLVDQIPANGCFWLKDWSENERVASAVVQAGLVVLTGRTARAGLCEAKEARLTS